MSDYGTRLVTLGGIVEQLHALRKKLGKAQHAEAFYFTESSLDVLLAALDPQPAATSKPLEFYDSPPGLGDPEPHAAGWAGRDAIAHLAQSQIDRLAFPVGFRAVLAVTDAAGSWVGVGTTTSRADTDAVLAAACHGDDRVYGVAIIATSTGTCGDCGARHVGLARSGLCGPCSMALRSRPQPAATTPAASSACPLCGINTPEGEIVIAGVRRVIEERNAARAQVRNRALRDALAAAQQKADALSDGDPGAVCGIISAIAKLLPPGACTCGEDDRDPAASLPHKTWCPKANA